MITIISDASLCRDTGAAGWAGCITGASPSPYRACGQVERLVESSSIAEIIAVERILGMGVGRGLIRGGRVLIRSDSRETLAVLAMLIPGTEILPSTDDMPMLCRAKRLTKSLRECHELGLITGRALAMDLTVGVQPLRSRPGPETADEHLHFVCDQQARAQMRVRRQRLYDAQIARAAG